MTKRTLPTYNLDPTDSTPLLCGRPLTLQQCVDTMREMYEKIKELETAQAQLKKDYRTLVQSTSWSDFRDRRNRSIENNDSEENKRLRKEAEVRSLAFLRNILSNQKR